MKMNNTLKLIFNIIYLLTIVHIWYVGYFVFKKRGLYTGDLPEEGREILDFYASHYLNGILHMIAACIGMPAATIFCLLGMGKDMQSQSIWVNAVNMSLILSCNCFLLNAYEWITSEKTI